MDEVRDLWNRVAADWRIQVGDDGDANRRLNSDPVLWDFVGDVRGLAVLDAGCGTGYLANKLHERGASVVGVDVAEEMIRIATASYPAVTFRVDSVSELRTVGDAEIDVIVSNYVLMDTPDLGAALRAFFRVLKPGGHVVAVFSHPCFPQGEEMTEDEHGASYRWDFPYFEARRRVDAPWAHFTSRFIWFHRPLSDYWKAFKDAGFGVVDFEEPRITPERYAMAESPERLRRCRTRPYSVAFKLVKPE